MYSIPATPRPGWSDLASTVRAQVPAVLGSEVVRARSAESGFGNGFAGVLTLADRRQVFAKLAARSVNPFAAASHREEIVVLEQMPAAAPVPQLVAAFDTELEIDGARDTWVGVVTEHVPGRWPDPRRADDLERLETLTVELSQLDPCPIPGLPRRVDDAGTFGRWDGPGASAVDLGSYGSGLVDNLDRIRGVAADWSAAMDGTALLHGDLRPDNVVTTEVRAFAVDWPAACIGAAWTDALLMVPALTLMRGAPDPARFLQRHPVLSEVDPAAVDAALAASLGYFVTSSLAPTPPGLPTIRAFQRAQADSVLAWLLQRWRLG